MLEGPLKKPNRIMAEKYRRGGVWADGRHPSMWSLEEEPSVCILAAVTAFVNLPMVTAIANKCTQNQERWPFAFRIRQTHDGSTYPNTQ